MVALPFSEFRIQAKRPPNKHLPNQILTIGDRIRQRRIELGLLQKDVAIIMGVTEDSITNWENNRHRPTKWYLPLIDQFLKM